jgi:hypothetical protein
VILSSVFLSQDSTDPRPVLPNDDEKVFCVKAHAGAFIHDFDMRKTLAIRAHFILTLHNKDSTVSENAIGFPCSAKVQVHNGRVILRTVRRFRTV